MHNGMQMANQHSWEEKECSFGDLSPVTESVIWPIIACSSKFFQIAFTAVVSHFSGETYDNGNDSLGLALSSRSAVSQVPCPHETEMGLIRASVWACPRYLCIHLFTIIHGFCLIGGVNGEPQNELFSLFWRGSVQPVSILHCVGNRHGWGNYNLAA